MAGAALLLAAGFVVLVGAFPETGQLLSEPTAAGGWVLGVTFPIGGWIVATKRPDNAMGWVFLGIGLSQALETFASAYATVAILVAPGSLPASDLMAWVGAWAWAPGFTLLLSAAVLLFPDGRPPTPRWRPVLWSAGLGLGLMVVPMATLAWGSDGADLLGPGPHSGGADDPMLSALLIAVNVGLLLMLASGALSVLGLVVRFRRSAGVARAQLKWFAAAGVVEISVLVFTSLVGLPWPALNVAVAVACAPLLPVAAGIAILRYRLYDIDRIVSRSVGYLLVTGALAVVFAVLVVALQGLLAPFTESNAVAVAGSTLVVASLFQPLRRRVQRAVDRRFNRAQVRPGRGRLHPRGRKPLPAAATSDPASRGSPLRPRPLRRRGDRDGLREPGQGGAWPERHPGGDGGNGSARGRPGLDRRLVAPGR
jgi:hypothetical protein